MLKSLKAAAVALASIGLVCPTIASAADVAPSHVPTPNVKLTEGVLKGRVIDGSGQPIVTTVTVQKDGKNFSTTKTAENGVYQVAGLDAGLYTIVTPVGSTPVRAWTSAAPPASLESLTLVDGPLVRGQIGGISPVVLVVGTVAVVGGTIAIVEATDDDDPVVSP